MSKNCLFCRSANNAFNQEEHIIPESLGNKEYILPKGIVCDKCNGYFSDIENYFCNYHLTSVAKLLFLDKTKKGKPPSIPLQEGCARKDKKGAIKFQQNILPGKEADQLSITFLAEDVIIRGSCPLPDTNSEKISRFLAKAGIEALYFKKQEFAYAAEFDFVRDYARYGGRNALIPFLWGQQIRQDIKLYILEVTSKEKGVFYFSTIFLAGSVYFIQLNRVDDNYALNCIAKQYKLKEFDKKCLIKRESPKFKIQLSTPTTK